MKSFQDQADDGILNADEFLNSWSQSVFQVPQHHLAPPRERMQQMISLSRNLWVQFNERRETLPKRYFDDKKYLDAYLAGYFLPNTQRVYSILTAPDMELYFRKIMQQQQIRVLDFGAGPLSGTAGFLFAFNYWHHKLRFTRPKNVEVYAVEHVDGAVARGKSILTSSVNIALDVTHFTSLAKVPEKVDLVLAINVLNEMLPKHHLKTASDLQQSLRDGGVVLIVEPGQSTHAKNLSILRNQMIASPSWPGFHVVAPCQHEKPCPLSLAERRDWCWHSVNWRRPPLTESVDFHTGLDHSQLNYSYFVFASGAKLTEYAYARVVSDVIQIAESKYETTQRFVLQNATSAEPELTVHAASKQLFKRVLCTQAGILEGHFTADHQHSYRGDIVAFDPTDGVLVPERLTTES